MMYVWFKMYVRLCVLCMSVCALLHNKKKLILRIFKAFCFTPDSNQVEGWPSAFSMIDNAWCGMYDVWFMMCDFIMYAMWCMSIILWLMMYDLGCMMHDLWCMIYDSWWMMMYDVRPAVTRLIVYRLLSVWCMMGDVWCMMYNVLFRDSWYIAYDLWFMIYEIWCWIYD